MAGDDHRSVVIDARHAAANLAANLAQRAPGDRYLPRRGQLPRPIERAAHVGRCRLDQHVAAMDRCLQLGKVQQDRSPYPIGGLTCDAHRPRIGRGCRPGTPAQLRLQNVGVVAVPGLGFVQSPAESSRGIAVDQRHGQFDDPHSGSGGLDPDL